MTGIAKLRTARKAKEQKRLDQYFTIAAPNAAAKNKRKLEEAKNSKKNTAKLQKGNGGKRIVKR